MNFITQEYASTIFKDYGAPIKWSIGTLFCHEDILFTMCRMWESFNVKPPIAWAFGMVQSPLAGGRVPPLKCDAEDAIGTLNVHLEKGIACRLTLSNPYATAEMAKSDRTTCQMLEFLNANYGTNRNGVIVASEELARHLKDSYPNLEIILSTIYTAWNVGYGRTKDTLEWYSRLLENPLYDVVVVNNAKIYEENFLESLSFKDKVELIACADCVRNCQIARRHYDSLMEYVALMSAGKDVAPANAKVEQVGEMCRLQRKSANARHASYSEEEIRRLAMMGYSQFKIAGRANSRDRMARDIWFYLFRHEVARYFETVML